MNTEIYRNRCSTPPSFASQLQLFPLDPWGSEQVVAVLDHPCPGVLRAMLGPLVLGDPAHFLGDTLQCLAVAEDGGFVTMMQFRGPGVQDIESVWKQVIHEIEMASSAKMAEAIAAPITSNDCFRTWSSSATWVSRFRHGDPYGPSVRALSKLMGSLEFGTAPARDEDHARVEKQALLTIDNQVEFAVKLVLSALRSDLFEIVTRRPRMSIPMACQLLSLAKMHSPVAITYSLQALRTESFGVLELVTSGQPEDVALQIREAIFSGKSLPDAFEKFGITKAVHRRSLVQPPRNNNVASEDGAALCELAISGRDWLIAMRLATPLPLHDTDDWTGFGLLIQRLRSLNFINPAITPWLLKWCSKPSWKTSASRLESMTNQAQALVAAAKGLANLDVSFEEAVTLLLDLVDESRETGLWSNVCINVRLDSDSRAQLVMMVAHLSGNSIDQLMHEIFESQPAVPSNWVGPAFTIVKALNSTDLAMMHGEACKNCLQLLSTIIEYVGSGVGLYGVYSASGASGTIALRFDATERQPRVQVQEIAGVGNAIAHFDLCRMAQTLAESWVTDAQINEWVNYEAQCAAWRMRCTQTQRHITSYE